MPGATWWVTRGDALISRGATGTKSTQPRAESVVVDTPYDLASLTKPLATALLLALFEQDGILDLETPVQHWLPRLRGTRLGSRSLVALASHSAGLPAWRPLYLSERHLAGYVDRIAELPLDASPSTAYSDLGYIVLGEVLERASGTGLGQSFATRIAQPLGLARTGFGRPETFGDAAPTEIRNSYERELAGTAGAGHPWRESIPPGEVHDANAHGLGGVAGHAGLFGIASEVGALALATTNAGRLGLGAKARSRLQDVAPGATGRTTGFVVALASRAGRGILPDSAYGHTGFTGTSVWIEPVSATVWVLLANRVHPRVESRDFQYLRRGFHRVGRRLAAGECGRS